ncbi:uncharacterized protein F5147DRAFT_778471 [Suillus discolor]|uniref:Uncharacterized protein n=1 Tax=Suillus discolor TaxID=1912936 RepID=A0A9P7JP92_9AGAM|nr:uncharacterized protein F5147DRAFT_778471 [Suillus discolor]KAG2096106.1 hypothetical protein F5147DRAFT_778471 [Suillus discolor]
MLTSFTRFTVALALTFSVFGAAIPAATVTADTTSTVTPVGALWKNNVHERVTAAPAQTAIAEGRLAPSRRSGELWEGIEHEEVARDGGAPARRSGELWRGLEHVEISTSPDA